MNFFGLRRAKTGVEGSASSIALLRDYSWLEGSEEVATRFWVPERLNDALTSFSAAKGKSVSAVIREVLFCHVYGAHDFLVLSETHEPEQANRITFSRQGVGAPGTERGTRGGRMPELGKNYKQIKVWMPEKMREDLQTLADQNGITFSQHLREILVTELLGRVYLPDRQALVQEPEDYQAAAVQHDRDLAAWNSASGED